MPYSTGPRSSLPQLDSASAPATDEIEIALLTLRAEDNVSIGNSDLIQPTAIPKAADDE